MAIQKTLKFVKDVNGDVFLYKIQNNVLLASFNPSQNIIRESGDDYRFKIAENVNDLGFVLDYRSIDSLSCFPVIVEANINDFLIELSKKFFFLDKKPNQASVGVCPVGTLLIFKRNGNIDNTKLEINDFAIGIVENIFIKGIYLGVNQDLLISFDIKEQLEF